MSKTEKNCFNSIFENRGFIKLCETQDGYSVYGGFVEADMEKFLLLEIEGGMDKQWKELKVKVSSLRGLNAVTRAVKRKFSNLVGDLSTLDVIKDIAARICECWECIPQVKLSSLSSPTAIYQMLFTLACGRSEEDGTIFLKDGLCYIHSKEFDNVLKELRVSYVRCRLLNAFKLAGLIAFDSNRNEVHRTFKSIGKQDRFICLLPRQTENVCEASIFCTEERKEEREDDTKITLSAYMGGKNNTPMLEKLEALIPYNIKTLVEPFAGSAAVSWNCRKTGEFRLNDLDSNMSNLLAVVSDTFSSRELIQSLEKCGFSEDEFYDARSRSLLQNHTDRVEWARDELLLLSASYNAGRQSYCVSGDKEQLKRRIITNVKRVSERISTSSVRVTCQDAVEVIKEYSEKTDCFMYIDPPYRLDLVSSKEPLYRYVLTEEKQMEMLKCIQNAKCPIMLSGYKADDSENDLYCRMLDEAHGWVCLELGEFNKASSGKKGSREKEFVWINYRERIPEEAKYFVSLKNHGLPKGGAVHE